MSSSILNFAKTVTCLSGLLLASTALAADKQLDGVTLNIASMNDPFATVMTKIAPKFEELTGAKINVDILDYGSLMTKTTADFVSDSAGYDVVTMDIVLTGQYAESGFSVDLTDLIKRDADELALDDIYPVMMASLGGYKGKQVAYPFAGYANILSYRTDLFKEKGIAVPKTMEELVAAAKALTDKDNNIYGFVANGQKGAASAQDWMQYNAQMGGSILGEDGKPSLNSEANIKSLTVYKDLFEQAAPPGAADYDWGAREESFRQGLSATQQTWSVGASAYFDPDSKIAGKAGVALAPTGEGLPESYGVGGWALAINADISDKQQEASWEFIKWITSAEVQVEFNKMGASSFIRKSTLENAELNERFNFLPIVAQAFEKGNGDFRPRIPEYPEIQDLLGTAVNSVLVGDDSPEDALNKAQASAMKLF
nr:sugar ABC transporter substrate-binding protein [uncultured Cohaesibacter sp.]